MRSTDTNTTEIKRCVFVEVLINKAQVSEKYADAIWHTLTNKAKEDPVQAAQFHMQKYKLAK